MQVRCPRVYPRTPKHANRHHCLASVSPFRCRRTLQQTHTLDLSDSCLAVQREPAPTPLTSSLRVTSARRRVPCFGTAQTSRSIRLSYALVVAPSLGQQYSSNSSTPHAVCSSLSLAAQYRAQHRPHWRDKFFRASPHIRSSPTPSRQLASVLSVVITVRWQTQRIRRQHIRSSSASARPLAPVPSVVPTVHWQAQRILLLKRVPTSDSAHEEGLSTDSPSHRWPAAESAVQNRLQTQRFFTSLHFTCC